MGPTQSRKMPCAVYSYSAPSGVTVTRKAVPPPRPGHVLVRVQAAGVNPVDAKFVAGDKFPEMCVLQGSEPRHQGCLQTERIPKAHTLVHQDSNSLSSSCDAIVS